MYGPVLIYKPDGTFIGHAIMADGAPKLKSTNVYREEERPKLEETLVQLNHGRAVRDQWPDARDPAVERILADPDWESVEMVASQVIDDDNSYLVWLKVPVLDDWGNPVPDQWQDGPNVDMEASVIVYKTIMAPARPSDVFERTRKAQELVAQQRI